MPFAYWLRRHSLEVQFWGYETGNIVASITGAGGLRAFADSFVEAHRSTGYAPVAIALWLAREHPETFATARRHGDRGDRLPARLGGRPAIRPARGRRGQRPRGAAGAVAARLRDRPQRQSLHGRGLRLRRRILPAARRRPLPAAAEARGPGAELRRPLARRRRGDGARGRPVRRRPARHRAQRRHLPLGRLRRRRRPAHLPGRLLRRRRRARRRTGHRSAAACCRGCSRRAAGSPASSPAASTRRSAWAVRSLVHPGLFWVPQRTRETPPFRTSMLARLPWRVVTGALALATGTAAGACFALANLLWAIGDVAIGALDASPELGDRAAHRTAPGLISRGSCGSP